MAKSFSLSIVAVSRLLIVLALQIDSSTLIGDDTVIDDPVLAKARFFKDERAVFFDVTFSGKTFSFLIDTGSTGIWIDKKHSDLCTNKLSVRQVREAFGSDRTIQTFSIEDFCIGKLRIANCEVATADLSESQRMRGKVIDGVLGNNVLSESVLQIDHDAGLVRLLKHYQPEPGERVERFSLHQGCPVTRLGVTSEFTDALIDTGNYYGVSLAPALFEEMTSKRLLLLQPKKNYLGKYKSENRTMFFLKQVDFGGFSHENVEGLGANYSTVGMAVLSQFRLTLDYPNRRLYLKESADAKSTILPDASGVSWGKDESGIVVVDIEQSSPAFEAGLEIGDRLMRVNDQLIETKRLAEVRHMFSDAGKLVRVELNRGNETYSKEFKLRRTFPYPPVWPHKLSKTLD